YQPISYCDPQPSINTTTIVSIFSPPPLIVFLVSGLSLICTQRSASSHQVNQTEYIPSLEENCSRSRRLPHHLLCLSKQCLCTLVQFPWLPHARLSKL
ncbi:hypothetical protein K474DRAFT_1650155, partial [Panus rudis PR-1116 ss-1]